MNPSLLLFEKKWKEKIKTAPLFYAYERKVFIESLFKDLEAIQNKSLKDYIIPSPKT